MGKRRRSPEPVPEPVKRRRSPEPVPEPVKRRRSSEPSETKISPEPLIKPIHVQGEIFPAYGKRSAEQTYVSAGRIGSTDPLPDPLIIFKRSATPLPNPFIKFKRKDPLNLLLNQTK